MKRQLNTSIDEKIWWRIHTEIPKGEVTKIIETLWNVYFTQKEREENDEDKVKNHIQELEKQERELTLNLAEQKLLLQRLEADRFKRSKEEVKKAELLVEVMKKEGVLDNL